VTFINTDGMAFIGPGSEWFWTALQFTALAITFYAIYRQLRGQQEQVRDNAKLLRSQAHYNALMLAQRPFELLIDNPDLANVVTTGWKTPEALNDTDWTRCSLYLGMQFNAWEYLYYQHRDGSIPNEMWVGTDAYFINEIRTKPGLVRFWSEYQLAFDEPFRSYLAQEFAKKPLPATTQG
jgi:hypothetical protein